MIRCLLSTIVLFPLAAAAVECPSRLLVSGYFSDNVHVYDACNGAFERLLDPAGRIGGAQAVRIGPDGLLYVVSEKTGQILRYRADTFAYVDAFVTEGAAFHPTAFDFGPDGDLYVAGFNANVIKRYDGQTGTARGVVVDGAAAKFTGPDNGTRFGPDGKLYIAGYYSNNLVRYDPATGATVEIVAGQSGGLRHTRGILFEPGGANFLVTSEGSGEVLRFRTADGSFMGKLASGYPSPTGIAFHPDGRLLIAPGDESVIALDAATGAARGTVVAAGNGAIGGQTFVAVIPRGGASTVDPSQIGTQFWLVGAGNVSGKSLELDLGSGTGATFGAEFDPATVTRKRWGRLSIDFSDCRHGQMRWDSTGPDSAGFGIGGYAIERFLPSPATLRCEAEGFGAVAGSEWIAGHWWGGGARSGEGFLIDVDANGVAVVAWFTFRPVMP